MPAGWLMCSLNWLNIHLLKFAHRIPVLAEHSSISAITESNSPYLLKNKRCLYILTYICG